MGVVAGWMVCGTETAFGAVDIGMLCDLSKIAQKFSTWDTANKDKNAKIMIAVTWLSIINISFQEHKCEILNS